MTLIEKLYWGMIGGIIGIVFLYSVELIAGDDAHYLVWFLTGFSFSNISIAIAER